MADLRHRETFQLIDDLPRVLRNCAAIAPEIVITLPAVEALILARRIEENRTRLQIIKVAREPTGWDFFVYAYVASNAAAHILWPFILGVLHG